MGRHAGKFLIFILNMVSVAIFVFGIYFHKMVTIGMIRFGFCGFYCAPTQHMLYSAEDIFESVKDMEDNSRNIHMLVRM